MDTGWRVTVTGADDRVDIGKLVRLSREFPFVEWGILWAAKDERPRYPGMAWKEAFALAVEAYGLNASAHLCGILAREASAGRYWPPMPGYSRAQINGFLPTEDSGMLAKGAESVEIILQASSGDALPPIAAYQRRFPFYRVAALIDGSGGKGLVASSWPEAPERPKLGYAGGIRPDTVTDVLRALGDRPRTWIDLESGVRTDDRFDLAKVRALLATVDDYNKRHPGPVAS